MSDQPRFCEYCGAPLAVGGNFCEACGQPVIKPPIPPPPPPQAAQPSSEPTLMSTSTQRPEQPSPAQMFTPPPPVQAQQPFTPPQAVRSVAQQAYTPPPPAKKRSSALPIILGVGGCLGILCIAVVLIAAIFFINDRSEINDSSNVVPLIPTAESFVPDEPEPTLAPEPTQEALPGDSLPSDADLVWSEAVGQESSENYFAEDFSSNVREWPDVQDDFRTWGFEGSHYLAHLYTPDYIIWAYLPLEFTPDSVSFDAAVQPGFDKGGYGVLCYYQDEDNYHYVSIDTGFQEYSIGVVRGGEYEQLLEDWWMPTANLNDSPHAVNNIQVICHEEEMILFINEEYETQVSFPAVTQNRMAIFVETFEDVPAEGYKVLFDNLIAVQETQ